MNIAILTEGGVGWGLGHIARCSSLYQAFRLNGFSPEFIIHGDKTIVPLLSRTKYVCFNWRKESQKILRHLTGCDVVIIDSYLAPLKFYKSVAGNVQVPVYFDDNKRLDYPRGIIVNGTPSAKDLGYDLSNGKNLFLLGIKYCPLRKEFWPPPVTSNIREKIKTAFVTLGAGEHPFFTSLVRCLKENLSDCRIVGAYGAKLSGQQIRQVMAESDLAISGGGQTLYELARMGVPTIAIEMARNQHWNIQGLKKAGVIEFAGYANDNRFFNRLTVLIHEAKNLSWRKRRQKLARRLMDGQGSQRIVEAILKFKNRL